MPSNDREGTRPGHGPSEPWEPGLDLELPLDDRLGPALPIDPARADALVAAVVSAPPGPAGPPQSAASGSSTAEVAGSAGSSAAAGASSALGPSILAAAVVTALVAGALLMPDRAPPEAVHREPVRAPARPRIAPSAPSAPVPVVPAPVPPDRAAPALTQSPALRSGGVPMRARPAAARGETARAATDPIEAPAPVPVAPPEDLLARANGLRRAGDFVAAHGAYLDVVRAHPDREEAYVARHAAAALELERLGRPGDAVERYRAAVRQRPRGPLAQEARFGIAEALRAQGDLDGARAAYREFLEMHPDSMLAAAAHRRLSELE